MQLNYRGTFQINRDTKGQLKIEAQEETQCLYGLGYAHAMDRGMQMILMKILGYGQASQYLDDSDQMLETDIFFRKMNWSNNIEQALQDLNQEEIALLNAYCDGVNSYFKKSKPFEFKYLIPIKDINWTIKDCILMARMIGFLSLAQSQGSLESLFVDMVRNDISEAYLKEIFPDVIGAINLEQLKQVRIDRPLIPKDLRWLNGTSAAVASNSWIVSPKKSTTHSAILANDPHLEINRIPGVWYEINAASKDHSFSGATMPGVPVFLIGRNKKLSWGATYSFLDAYDSWLEEVKDGQYKKDEVWHSFTKREERIKRKKKPDHVETYYENEHGCLSSKPEQDGFYLSQQWACSKGGARSLSAGLKIWKAGSVKEGMDILGELEVSFNWSLADSEGNIGMQMSGLAPVRAEGESGFTPLNGWDSKHDWQGFHKKEDLPRSYNPEEGFIVTANENLSRYGGRAVQNSTMGTYRSDRIRSLLSQKEKHSPEDFQSMFYDVYSVQAELFMPLILKHLGTDDKSTILKEWDRCYDIQSKGAYLFEAIYSQLYKETFNPIFGEKVQAFLQDETDIYIDFYAHFDRILLQPESIFFKERSQDEIFKASIQKAFEAPLKSWGDVNAITYKHLILGDALPNFLGFNKGPEPLPGNRATIHQGQVFRSAGRETSFAPSIRILADMGTDYILSNTTAGVSDRRFSKWYFNNHEMWKKGVFNKNQV